MKYQLSSHLVSIIIIIIVVCIMHNDYATVYTDEINNFVDVSFDTTTRQFLCTFINNQDPSEKSCSVILYRDCKEQDVLTTQVNSNETQIVLVVGNLQSDSSVYCYVVAASNDTITVNINGTITIGQSKSLIRLITLLLRS